MYSLCFRFFKSYWAFGFISILPFIMGCAHNKIKAKKLMNVSIGMDKSQVLKSLGEPAVVRGAITNKFGQVIEIWEYSVTKGRTSNETARFAIATVCSLGLYSPLFLYDGEIQDYWLYFNNDKLVQWGKAGDWKEAADHIQEIRFG